MDLFNDTPTNLLPKDGTAIYYGTIFKRTVANQYLAYLLNEIPWKQDEAVIYGKLITTKRKVAWLGDAPFQYTYSNTTKQALPWQPELLQLKTIVEATTQETYNSCLLNLYHTGAEGMAWHRDAEKDLKKHGAIASLSFGAERRFDFKHTIDQMQLSVMLEHGSLLVMKDAIQSFWLHRLPVSTVIQKPRVSLTFRTIVTE